MEFIYVLLALAVAVGAYFLFFKKAEPALPPREEPAPSKQKSERAAAPSAKAESTKAKAAKPVSEEAPATCSGSARRAAVDAPATSITTRAPVRQDAGARSDRTQGA
jgi:hypothetical protein